MKKLIKLGAISAVIATSFGASADSLDVGFTGSIGPSPCDITADPAITIPPITYDTLPAVETLTDIIGQQLTVDISCAGGGPTPVLVFFTLAQDPISDGNGDYLPSSSNMNINNFLVKTLPILADDNSIKGFMEFRSATSNPFVDSTNMTVTQNQTLIFFDSLDKPYISPTGNVTTDALDSLSVTAPWTGTYDMKYHIDKNLIDASATTPLTASFNATITYL